MIDRLCASPGCVSAWVAGFVLLSMASVLQAAEVFEIEGDRGTRLRAESVARFDGPWAMTFLPNGALLVTEQSGRLWCVDAHGAKAAVTGVPEVAYGGQGGLGDIVLAPDFETSDRVYLSYAAREEDSVRQGAVVVSARLKTGAGQPRLTDIQEIWRQQPFVTGNGHYSHRMAFGPAGTPQAGYLFITSGERQKQSPAQSLETNLGKIVRLKANGDVPDDNPFAEKGGIARQFWSIGHRNLLGIAFDDRGQLWAQEMGPRHGDELNRIEPGANYGWPVVSEGDHYSGQAIPDHETRPEFMPPALAWVPAISPAGLAIYSGDMFPAWRGHALLGGLSSKALIRVDLGAAQPREAERYRWGERVREVEVGPEGALWVLEDNEGRLLRLTPAGA